MDTVMKMMMTVMTVDQDNINNSERPVDALAVKKMNDWLTHNLKSRDASASKNVINTCNCSYSRQVMYEWQ